MAEPGSVLDKLIHDLRIDNIEGEETSVESFMDAAITIINGKTGKTKIIKDGTEQDISTDKLWYTAVLFLVSHWYDNRGVQKPGQTSKIEFSVDALINHISMCGDYV